jgi:hypothetical protein
LDFLPFETLDRDSTHTRTLGYPGEDLAADNVHVELLCQLAADFTPAHARLTGDCDTGLELDPSLFTPFFQLLVQELPVGLHVFA